MTAIASTLNTSISGGKLTQALQILQSTPPGMLQAFAQHAGDDSTSPFAFVALPGQVGKAVTAIMNILLDAQGNEQLGIVAKNGYVSARTGGGDDTISVDAHRAYWVTSGGGNDNIAVRAYANQSADNYGGNIAVSEVHGGAGDDKITIRSYGDNGEPADGAADSDIRNAGDIQHVTGGSGNDTIDIQGRVIWSVYGDDGDDDINIRGTVVNTIYGGEGNDTMRIIATSDGVVAGQASANGGDGNDTIEITGDRIGVSGDKGDDTITLNNTGTGAAGITVRVGDGHDTVTTNGAVSINRSNGTNKWSDLSQIAIVDRIDDSTVKVSYTDTDDTITLHLTGDMVGKQLAVDFHLAGNMTIRSVDMPESDLPARLASLNPVLATRVA